MSLFRSQPVDLYEILIPKDNDWDIMNELGNLNYMHFINLNKNEQPHHLRYHSLVKRCEDSEFLIKEIETICDLYNVHLHSPANIEQFLHQVNMYTVQRGKAAHLLFTDIENDLVDKGRFLKQQQQGLENMVVHFKTILAKITILHQALKLIVPQGYGGAGDISNNQQFQSLANIDREESQSMSVGISGVRNDLRESLLSNDRSRIVYLGGLLPKTEQMSFKKLLFRATRGKALCQIYNIEKTSRDTLIDVAQDENKFIYLVMFEDGGYLRDKIMKICNAMQEPVFEINKKEARRQLQNLETQKEDARNYILQTKKQIRQFLVEMNKMEGGNYSLLEIYKWFILKEKAIYIELNKLKYSEKILMGLLWCPTKFRHDLETKLDDIRNHRNIEGPQIHLIQDYEKYNLQRPTYFETNEFSWPFQEIVNTYGIPQYQEVNPAVFTMVTFPFLFGVMFGDIMHGAILFVFSTYLCFSNPQKGTILFEMKKIRYLLLLMGLFSTYCGFIYNDFTSIPIELFGKSCYVTDHSTGIVTEKNDCVYPVGVDPKWYLAKNELAFLNSLKMKISVILGVMQMSLGVLMKAFNSLYFGRTIDFAFEFIPQITLLWSLFGFMDIMIIIKWLTDYSQYIGAKPPSIISQMIVMCLNFGSQNEGPLKETELFHNQIMIMRTLLIIALITIPVMLFVKPVYEYKKNQSHQEERRTVVQDDQGHERQYQAINDEPPVHAINEQSRQSALDLKSIDQDQNRDSIEKTGSKQGHHGFSDLFIHQLIETIEFSLGTVSNTASYLRLWALSLAHSQLAKVFFDNTVKPGLQSRSFIAVSFIYYYSFSNKKYLQSFFGYFVFFAFTVSVLLMMDLMEAFLHTLRLHWVEFQNKFYRGNGIRFTPYSFENTLKTAQQQDKKIKKKVTVANSSVNSKAT